MLVAAVPGCKPHYFAATAAEARTAVRMQPAMLSLISNELPDGSCVDVLADLHLAAPRMRSVVVATTGSKSEWLRALHAGAQAYLLKDEPEDALIRQLKGVMRGELCLSPTLAGHMLQVLRGTPCPAPDSRGLSAKQREVLRLITRGMKVSVIAARMGVHTCTVQTYVRRIYDRLGVSNRAAVTTLAIEMGL